MRHLSSDGLRGLDFFTNASTNNNRPGPVHLFASLDEDFDRTSRIMMTERQRKYIIEGKDAKNDTFQAST